MTDKTDSKEREALRKIGEEQAFEAWFKVDCPVEGANAKIAAKAAWKARAALAATALPEGITRDDTVHGETYFTAADMATAAAQGFREGVASVAASAGSEPVAWTGGEEWEQLAWHLCAEEHGEDACDELIWEGGPIPEPWGDRWMKYESDAKRMIELVRRFYTHPSPPEGMAGGWQDIATAPKDGTRILLHPAVEVHDAWSKGYWSEQQECWIVGGSASGVAHTYWLPLPPAPPTTCAGSGKVE